MRRTPVGRLCQSVVGHPCPGLAGLFCPGPVDLSSLVVAGRFALAVAARFSRVAAGQFCRDVVALSSPGAADQLLLDAAGSYEEVAPASRAVPDVARHRFATLGGSGGYRAAIPCC